MSHSVLVVLIIIAVLLPGIWLLLRFVDSSKSADWGGWMNYVVGAICLFCRHYHRFRGPNLNLPAEGGAIVAANHVSGLDGLILVTASPRPLRFLIAREEYERFGLHWLFKAAHCIPVERSGQPELAFRQALRALKQGEVLAIFPHGAFQLDHHPRKKLKGGVAKLALLSQCPVFPVRLDGIRAQGHTILSLPVRSRVELKVGDPIALGDNKGNHHFLEQLAQFIEDRDEVVAS